MIFELKKAAKQLLFNSKKLKSTDTQGAIEEVAEGMIYGEVKTGEYAKNAANSVLPEVTVYGKNVQAGEPTPDVSVDIVSVDKVLSVISCGKKYFDGELLQGDFSLSTGEYRYKNGYVCCKNPTPCKSGDVVKISLGEFPSHIYIYYYNGNSYVSNDAKYGVISAEFTVPSDITHFKLCIGNGSTTLSNAPQICVTINGKMSDNESKASIGLADDLRGIPVTEGGNYVDENGQSWICDTIEKYADGTGLWTKRIKHEVFDGSDDENWVVDPSGSIMPYAYINEAGRYVPYSSYVMSNYYKNTGINTNTYGNIYVNHGGVLIVCDNRFTQTVDYKAWLKANPVTIDTILPDPMTVSLSADQVSAFELLHSFDPYTTVMTDDIADVRATYLVNTPAGKAMGNHAHDDKYYRRETINGMLSTKSPMVHIHDDRYYTMDETYTKDEVNQQLGYKVSQAEFAEHKANFLITQSFKVSGSSLSPHVMAGQDISIEKSGYTPIGIVSYDADPCYINVGKLKLVPADNKVELEYYNCSDLDIDMYSIEVTVLYADK